MKRKSTLRQAFKVQKLGQKSGENYSKMVKTLRIPKACPKKYYSYEKDVYCKAMMINDNTLVI